MVSLSQKSCDKYYNDILSQETVLSNTISIKKRKSSSIDSFDEFNKELIFEFSPCNKDKKDTLILSLFNYDDDNSIKKIDYKNSRYSSSSFSWNSIIDSHRDKKRLKSSNPNSPIESEKGFFKMERSNSVPPYITQITYANYIKWKKKNQKKTEKKSKLKTTNINDIKYKNYNSNIKSNLYDYIFESEDILKKIEKNETSEEDFDTNKNKEIEECNIVRIKSDSTVSDIDNEEDKDIIFSIYNYSFDHLINKSWVKKNNETISYLKNNNVIRDQINDLIIDLINEKKDNILNVNLSLYREELSERIKSFSLENLLYFKINKCMKEQECICNNRTDLCPYYHEFSDDFNCLIYIIFYNTFRYKECTKKKCNKKSRCCFYHKETNKSPSCIKEKIISTLKFMDSNKNKYISLFNFIIDRLNKIMTLNDYSYIMKKSDLFHLIKFSNFKIDHPIPTRYRSGSISQPTSPKKPKKINKNLFYNRGKGMRSLSFNDHNNNSQNSKTPWHKWGNDNPHFGLQRSKNLKDFCKKQQKDKETDIVWIENNTHDRLSSISSEIDNIEDRKSPNLSDDDRFDTYVSDTDI